MICDLHTHSNFSDGTATPAEIVAEAVQAGLAAVALTDHNTARGLPDFISAAEKNNIIPVPGVEFSVDYEGSELHLLGLFIKPEHFPAVEELMREGARRKEESNLALIEALSDAGIKLDYAEIKGKTPGGQVNRAHIATAMMEAGYVGSVKEAFRSYLSKTGGFYKEPQRISVWQMLEFINSIGAVSVLAHPFLNLTDEELEILLPKAKEAGLVGMECYYSLYDEVTTADSLALAEKFGLLPSGGSDYHGERKPGIEVGVGFGNLSIPYAWCENLKNSK